MTQKKRRHKATKFIRKGTGLSMADSAKVARIFQRGDQGWETFPKDAFVRFTWYSNGCSCCAPTRMGVEDIEGPKGTVEAREIQNFFQ